MKEKKKRKKEKKRKKKKNARRKKKNARSFKKKKRKKKSKKEQKTQEEKTGKKTQEKNGKFKNKSKERQTNQKRKTKTKNPTKKNEESKNKNEQSKSRNTKNQKTETRTIKKKKRKNTKKNEFVKEEAKTRTTLHVLHCLRQAACKTNDTSRARNLGRPLATHLKMTKRAFPPSPANGYVRSRAFFRIAPSMVAALGHAVPSRRTGNTLESSGRLHRQVREHKGMVRRRRLQRRKRKDCEIDPRMAAGGKNCVGADANGPCWDLIMAWSTSPNSAVNWETNPSSTRQVASCCHPLFGWEHSPSTSAS